MQNQMFNLMNSQNMVKQFIEFRNNFTGNPQAEVARLLRQGKMTQEQLNQLQDMANQFRAILTSCK